jgi:nondiscriminating glutamyl-tRNA synthetase
MSVRVRFAPSPTGYLHVGGARTALYNYLFAKKNAGQFILRIEDTDEVRSTEESLQMVLSDLTWLGLEWDEGPLFGALAGKEQGSFGPYKQSERKEIYKRVAQELLEKGLAYYCFLTDEEVEKQREEFIARGLPPHVQSPYENWGLQEALEKLKSGVSAVVRFKTKHLRKDYTFQDIVRGEVKFPSDMVGDFVLLRSGGMPVYNFCCVVDDHMMQISHVLRAEEHLSNTLRQLMIYEAMGWKAPEFGHLSLILDEDRKKLSKRRGATSCHEFMLEGYLPAALKNFILLLGWSHPEGKEIFAQDEMISTFTTDRFHPAGAVFDSVKLKWMNAQYLRATPEGELWKLVEPFLNKAGLSLSKDPKWQEQSLAVFKSSMETLADAVELYRHFDDAQFKLAPESREVLGWESSRSVLSHWLNELELHGDTSLTEAEFLNLQDRVKELSGAKGKFLFMPIRVAVIGKPQGTELKHLVPLMTIQQLKIRAKEALGGLA